MRDRGPPVYAWGMETPARGTLADALAERLADDIVDGRLAPGLRLEEPDLAARFQVSRTPVREALRLLTAAGLVERRPNRGVVVASLSGERVAQMFEAMAELEAVCTRLATERMTARERLELDALHRESAALVRSGDRPGYESVNAALHATLHRGSHNDELAGMAEAQRRRVAPFRRARFNRLGQLAESWAEHDRLVRAVLAGDSDTAGRIMRAHALAAGRE